MQKLFVLATMLVVAAEATAHPAAIAVPVARVPGRPLRNLLNRLFPNRKQAQLDAMAAGLAPVGFVMIRSPTLMALPPLESGDIALNQPIDFFVNSQRARAGLPAVAVDPALSTQAAIAIAGLARKSLLQQQPALPFKQALGRGFRTPAGVVTAWMTSPAQAAVVLAPECSHCGYATVTGTDDKRYDLLLMTK